MGRAINFKPERGAALPKVLSPCCCKHSESSESPAPIDPDTNMWPCWSVAQLFFRALVRMSYMLWQPREVCNAYILISISCAHDRIIAYAPYILLKNLKQEQIPILSMIINVNCFRSLIRVAFIMDHTNIVPVCSY